MRVLMVEDDEVLGSALKSGLLLHNWTVDWAKDGATGLKALLSEHFDVVVLDLMLPKIVGMDVLEYIRSKGISVPVMILTTRDNPEDKIKGFNKGADDYVIKPFNLAEVNARLLALIRRSKERATSTVKVGRLVLDPIGRLVYKDSTLIELSRREFVLLSILLENAGKVMTREKIIQSIYGWGDDIDSNALEVHIHNLRKKVGEDIILTVRGVGYWIKKEEESATAAAA